MSSLCEKSNVGASQHNRSINPQRHPFSRHKPLDIARLQIRLLSFRRDSSADNKIHSNIETFDLGAAPKYVALSYVWGSQGPKAKILVNHQDFLVGQNLLDFLETFRASVENEHFLWIDQLCIDQDDTLEKNHQVKMMTQIYTGCHFALIWLDKELASARTVDDEDDMDFAILDIFHRRYFTRLWIVQEVSLPSEINVIYGNSLVSWWQIESHAFYWKQPEPAVHLLRDRKSQSENYPEKSMNMGHVLRKYSSGACMDPRDKVYGSLGLCEGTDSIEIDYNKPVTKVLTDTILALVTNAWDTSHKYADLRIFGVEELSRLLCQLTDEMVPLRTRSPEPLSTDALRPAGSKFGSRLYKYLNQWLNDAYVSLPEIDSSTLLKLCFREDSDKKEAGFWYEYEGQGEHLSFYYHDHLRRVMK